MSSHTPHLSSFSLMYWNRLVSFFPRVAGVVVHCLRIALLWMWAHRIQGSQAAAVSKTRRGQPLVLPSGRDLVDKMVQRQQCRIERERYFQL